MDPRQEMKQNLVPRLRELGLLGSFPHLRRVEGQRKDFDSTLAMLRTQGAEFHAGIEP